MIKKMKVLNKKQKHSLQKERNLKKHGERLIKAQIKVVCSISRTLKISSELHFQITNGDLSHKVYLSEYYFKSNEFKIQAFLIM